MLEKAAKESGVARIAFTGGEPLLRDDLPELVFSVKRLGARASLLTNGVLLDRSWVADLQKAGVAQIQLTLLGMDPAVHDEHCGDGQFDRVMASLELLGSMGAHSVVNMVVTKKNVDEIPAVMRFIAERRQPRFLINRFNPGGNGLGEERLAELMLDREDAIAMLRHAQKGAREHSIEPAAAVPIPPCVVDHKRYPDVLFAGCNAATDRSYFALDALGNVRACNHSPQILGNVLDRPFLEIANSGAVKDWKRIKPKFCEPCPGWDACKGGCRAAGQQMGLGLEELDPWVSHCLGDDDAPAPR
jgi:radical SAM protein with 4Fe4S-binding SPASM domain